MTTTAPAPLLKTVDSKKFVPARHARKPPTTAMHAVWRKVRRPFRVPSCCAGCTKWEVYDADKAGCLRCGAEHACVLNSVDCMCPLVTTKESHRVCSITGAVLNEVRSAAGEYCDTACFAPAPSSSRELSTSSYAPRPSPQSFSHEISSVVRHMLQSDDAKRCRRTENRKLYDRLGAHMCKQMKIFKLENPGARPCVARILASALAQERYWHFIDAPSPELVSCCSSAIDSCVAELIRRNVKVVSGPRLKDLVCGMLYMLRTGLVCHDRILLRAIPEDAECGGTGANTPGAA
mmetsp:Transcript_58598/g.154928  ORF Transcript_58598/g.154928 Transcript_58598/m.154928 type:complete len:292 (+) Transcript_58598:4687-5562(+)